MAKIKLVAAYSLPTFSIGADGRLPWRYKEDLAFFKSMTTNCVLVGGVHTSKEVRFLARPTVVVSRKLGITFEKALLTAKEIAKELSFDIAIVGGQEIFKEGLKVADELYLTEIRKDFSGDKFFEHPRNWSNNFEKTWMFTYSHIPELTFVHWRRK